MSPGTSIRLAGALVILLAAALAGCIVPIPERAGPLKGQRGNIGDRVPIFIAEGRTTREDVLLTLGEPDRRANADRWFAYDSAHRSDAVSLAVVAAGGYTGNLGLLGTYQTIAWRELVLHFDAQGLVSKAEFLEQRDRGFSFAESPPYPHAKRTLQPSPTMQAYRDALRTFVPAEAGERLREGFVAAACQIRGEWHDAVVFVTDRAVYCWTPSPAEGGAPVTLLRWSAHEILAADWAPPPITPDRPAVELRHRDGPAAVLAFRPLEGSAADFDRERAERFLDAVRTWPRAAASP